MAMVCFGLCVHAQNTNTYTQAQVNPPPKPAAPYTGDYVGHFGVGFQVGAPTGINAKYWLTDTHAVDGAFGWSPYSHASAQIHADFLFNNFNLLSPSSGRMPVYYGAGVFGRFRNDGRSSLGGFRFPIGISYMFDGTTIAGMPVDIFGEVAPEAIVVPFVRIGIDGMVGFRVWF